MPSSSIARLFSSCPCQEPTFINLDAAYLNQVFHYLGVGDDRSNVGELPRVDAHVCESGVIQDYRGVPEIVVRNDGQLSH
jgi:hypothetical protein